MNTKIVVTALVILIGGIFSTATSSIAVECYNKPENEAFKKEKQNNFNFVILNLISAILMILVGLYCLYAGATADSK